MMCTIEVEFETTDFAVELLAECHCFLAFRTCEHPLELESGLESQVPVL